MIMDPKWTPGLEMLYENIRPNIIYNGKRFIPLPRAAAPNGVDETDEETEENSARPKNGYGNVLFYLTPSQEDTIVEIQSDYLRWYLGLYKWYTIDSRFREKIGKKRLVVNMNQVIKRDWAKTHFPHPLRYMAPMQRKSLLRKHPNLIVDLGEWSKYYFEYSYKMTIPVIVKNYVKFLASKLKAQDWDGYTNRILYIPINRWFGDAHNALGFTRRQLNNPLAIILFAAYKFPEVLAELPEMTIFLGDSEKDQFVMYKTSDFTKKNFHKIKMRLKLFKGFKWDDESENNLDVQFSEEEEDEESPLNNQPDTDRYSDPHQVIKQPEKDATVEEKAKASLKEENRARLINDMKRGLMGDQPKEKDNALKKRKEEKEIPVAPKNTGNAPTKTPSQTKAPSTKEPTHKVEPKKNAIVTPAKASTPMAKAKSKVGKPVKATNAKPIQDLTVDEDIYDEEDIEEQEDDTTPIHLEDDELDDAVQDAIDEELKELEEDDPDILLNEEGDLTAETLSTQVKKRLKSTYMPPHTEAQIAKMKEMQTNQDKILKKMPTAQQIKSKQIDSSDFSNVVKSSNKAITNSKFVNFDRNYNEKKLQSDIDNAVGSLSKASSKIFVTDKIEEDTSTQLDLKKTVTYKLEDEWGNKFSVKVDIPIVVDDKYIVVNGQKQLIGHQEVMMPIVKSGPAQVQVVTWYQKLIMVRQGINDSRTNSVKRYMEQHNDQFNITMGNAMAKNNDGLFVSTLDIDMYARQMMSFKVGSHCTFILDRAALLDKISKLYPNEKVHNDQDHIPVGYDTSKKSVIYVTAEKSLTDLILDRLSNDAKNKISSSTKNAERKRLRTTIKIKDQMVPLVLILFFFEGFSQVMKKAEINYQVVDKEDDLHDLDRSKYGILECADKYILWERNPLWNAMLLNGFGAQDLAIFNFDELDDRDTYANILTNYFASKNISNFLLQYYDFMIDPVTEEILEDFELPTDLVSLLLLGNRMLADNTFTPINDMKAVRIRSNEIIAQSVYRAITRGYAPYRNSLGNMGRNRKPKAIDVKQNAVISEITRGSPLTSEASVLNPILELEKARAVSPKGITGIGKDRAMTLPKRAYDDSMVGVLGITTSPDAKVGVTRQMTLEPNITSTRGYVKTTDKKDYDQLSNANLLTPAELLSPPGVLHDDGPRTAMSYKQTQYMLPVDGSTPVFFGNKVESVVPYHMSREFVVTAKQDGKVVEIKDGIVVVQYKDGTYDSYDTNPRMKKNSSSGFYIKTEMKSNFTEVGQSFKKNEILAQDPRAFTKNRDRSASMNIGVPIKVAILPNYDIYEDAGPITTKLSQKFTAYMSMKEEVGIPANSYVEKMVDVGDKVKVDDPLIIYDPAHEDEETNAFLNEIRSKLGENLSDMVDLQSMPQVRTDHAGTISAIEVYTSVPVEELSPSLQAIVKKYTAHAKNVVKTLDKYKNEGDLNYYKCGQVISNAPEVVKPDYMHRVKGVLIPGDGRGVAIIFYIEFKDIAKTGDKGSAFTALKFVTSHVVPEGLEAYSEYRPDEEISTIIAPSSVVKRKTPSIQETMFANKCIIEMKRHALTIFFDDKDPNK